MSKDKKSRIPVTPQKGVLTPGGGGGGGLGGMIRRFRSDDTHFGDFQSDWVPILYLNTIRLTPSFC